MGIYYPFTVLNIFKTSFKGYSSFVVFKGLNEILYVNHSAQTGAKETRVIFCLQNSFICSTPAWKAFCVSGQ